MIDRVRRWLLLAVVVLAAAVVAAMAPSTTTANGATFAYDVPTIARVDVHEFEAGAISPSGVREGSVSPSAAAQGTSTISTHALVATEAGGARFVVNSAGDALDTAQVTIPAGKYNYLLENPSKSGVFADSMGFNQASLDSALRSHLVDNFGTATPSVSMVGGGTKFSVTGPMVGPSGAKWTITTAWGVDVDGTIRLITATP